MQFDNFDEEQSCIVKIKDNKAYQGRKDFTLEIYNPTKAILGTVVLISFELNT